MFEHRFLSWRRLKPAHLPLVELARQRIERPFLELLGGPGAPQLDLSQGDAGLFGPDSVTWRVHSDLSSMLVGGVSALLLQALPPLALHGVLYHSRFREDPLGRLRRTAAFIAGTTYGSTATALELINRVRRVHATVVGTTPDGRAYAADDPHLLTWVHVAEVTSFLRGHLCYSGQSLPPAEKDRYFEEVAQIAELLGATEVPRSTLEVRAYFRRIRPELDFGTPAREIAIFLRRATTVPGTISPAGRIMFESAIDLLPGWAQELMGVRRLGAVRRTLVRPTVRLGASCLRRVIRDGAAVRARRRVAALGYGG